jgi:Protein of unknown function, DUF481
MFRRRIEMMNPCKFLVRFPRVNACHAAVLALAILPLASAPLAAAGQAATAGADVLTFTNGDQLTGKVVSESGGVVTFQSDMAIDSSKTDGSGGGTITVPWSRIKTLRSAQKFAVITKDQQLRVGRPAPQVPVGTVSATSDQVSVSGVGGEIKNIPTKDAAYLVDEASFEKTIAREPSFLHGWHGAAVLGASLVESTQTSRTFTGALSLARPIPGVDWMRPRNNTLLNATASYGSVTQPAVGTTLASSARTNILHGDIERDEYLTPRFYVLADASADHNIGSGLQLQQGYGVGAGYSVIQQAVQTLDVKGDIHYGRQDFYAAGPGIPAVSLNLIGANIGEIYMRKLVHGLIFNESALVQPAFNHPSAFTAQIIAGLIFPVYKNFGFSAGAQDNYINNPPSGYKSNTFQFTGGLNYTFK